MGALFLYRPAVHRTLTSDSRRWTALKQIGIGKSIKP
jgi:hypothetical protein